jgi:hypothetical protein
MEFSSLIFFRRNFEYSKLLEKKLPQGNFNPDDRETLKITTKEKTNLLIRIKPKEALNVSKI